METAMNEQSVLDLRQNIRGLLYAYPLTDFVKDHELHVCIRGSKDAAFAALTEAYPLGQIAYMEDGRADFVKLSFVLVTEDADAWKEELSLRCPGLSDFPEYGEIRFSDTSE